MVYFVLYNLVIILLYPLLFPGLLFVSLTNHKFTGTMKERFGRYDCAGGAASIWVHAVSVGEAVGAIPLIRMILEREPGRRVVVTTATKGGREVLLKELGNKVVVAYSPLDFPWVVSRAVKKFNPSALLLMETEIWPNLISECARRGAPVILLNGRVSDRAAAASGFVLGVYGFALPLFSALGMQNGGDADRIKKLGAPAERVHVLGNIKFDGIPGAEDMAKTEALRKIAGLKDEPLFVAGSTHPGEEEMMMDVFGAIRKALPSLRMIIAPRHIERSQQVLELISNHSTGVSCELRTKLEKADAPKPDVIVWDTIGELRALYSMASACFVGGSLIERGGHNILEPAACGKAPFYGPNMANFRASVDALQEGGGGVQVESAEQLAGSLKKYLTDDQGMKKLDAAALETIRKNSGASERAYELFKSHDRLKTRGKG